MPLATIEEAVEEFRRGNFVIIIDDKDRENEGDLCIPAEKITPEKVNFMAKYGRGLICTPLTGQRLDELRIPLMVSNNNTMYGTAFTVSVESRHGVASGISASDRAKTVKVLVDPNTTPSDLIMPGHTFPLRACDGGVLVRAGHTEASIDLAKLADLYPGAVVCEIMDEDGKMMRLPQLEEFAARHGIKIISIASLIEYRYRTETIARRVARSRIPTDYGEFTALAYESTADWQEGIALVVGTITPEEPVLVRVHSQCATGDALGSLRCDCGMQLRLAMKMVQEEGTGIILYLNQEGRGIGSDEQDARLRIAGWRFGYRRGESSPRPGRGPAQLRLWLPGAQRPRRIQGALAHEQSHQSGSAEHLRPGNGRARAPQRATK